MTDKVPDGAQTSNGPHPSLRSKALTGVLWSAVQNWGSRIIALLLSILLARLLSPVEFGIASAAGLALLLVPLIAEMGFSDAIMQRRELAEDDLNLPFVVSLATALALVLLIIVFRAPIAAWAGLGRYDSYLVAIAVTVLISVPNSFQEAMYKRQLKFRDLAFRAFVANIVGGAAALSAALAGFGVWTFLVQFYVSLIINVVWIWSRPAWLPRLRLHLPSFLQMIRIGAPILLQRIIDFLGTRTLDVVIISKIGLPSYGVYVVGSRIYQTLLQMLQGAVYDVSLTLLSSISQETDRIIKVYRQTLIATSTFVSPIFILLAAIAPEICDVLFGDKWTGVADIAQPLLIMGAVHCVQYMNGSFLSARGKPELILITGIAKSISQVLAVLFVPSTSVSETTAIFVVAGIAVAPLSFYVVAAELGMPYWRVVKLLIESAIVLSVSFVVVGLARGYLELLQWPNVAQGAFLGLIFAITYACLVAVVSRNNVQIAYAVFKKSRGK